MYKNVVDLNQSGTSAEDTLVKAKELYMAKYPKGKSFSFLSCWKVLKEVPKWQELGPLISKKMKKASDPLKTTQVLRDVSNLQTSPDPDSPPLMSSGSIDCESTFKRPQGNQAEKDMLKCQKLQDKVLINQLKASQEMAAAILQKV